MWRGDPSLSLAEQGVKVLGTPLGHTEFLKAQLREVINSHSILWERIPSVPDLQSAWLLFVFCAATRANYLLRSVPPDVADEYARDHDDAMRRCMSQLLDVEILDESWAVVSLPLSIGGLGLRNASQMSTLVYWASWADCLCTVQQRYPAVGDQISSALSRGAPGRYLDAAASCRERLLDVSFELPPWEDLQRGALPRQHELDDAEPGVKRHGWQFGASQKVDDCFLSGALWPGLSLPSRALLRSQGGPLAGLPFTCFPTAAHSRFDAQPFRLLLLRRLWLPLPSSARNCRCGLPLDSSGHHRAACAVAGVLGRRGFAVESAAACVCREAGARVSLNVRVQDMDLARPSAFDNRRLEIVADGLPLFHGAQSAVDTTVVSVLRRDGTPHPRCVTTDRAALETARRRKETTYPELSGQFGRTKLVVLVAEVAGRWSEECRSFLSQLAKAKVRGEAPHLRARPQQAWCSRWGTMFHVRCPGGCQVRAWVSGPRLAHFCF